MPPKAQTLTDLVAELQAAQLNLGYVESEVSKHVATPLNEATVDYLMEFVTNAKKDILDIIKKIIVLNPPDLVDHQNNFKTDMSKTTSLHSTLHGIKMAFPPQATPKPTGPPPQSTFKLPTLELPSFDGSIHNWVSFRDMFVTIVDTNTTLSGAQKLTYLKSKLTGEALRQINSIIICDVNYDIAWKLLNDRYHSEKELFFAIMKRFHEQSSVSHNSASCIRLAVDTAKEFLSSLEKLSLPTDGTPSSFVMYHITTKLDNKSRELWEQSLNDSKIPTLTQLFEFLESRARSISSGETSRSSNASSRPSQGNIDNNRRQRVHHTHSSTNCNFCKSEFHPLFRCSMFQKASPADRHAFVKRAHACYNCLNHGHITKDCPSQSSCRTCRQRHHTLLHLQRDAASQQGTSSAERQQEVSLHHHQQSPQVSTSQTLLATALVKVLDADGLPHVCRALLDGGSTASFITDKLLKELRLPRYKSNATIKGLSSAPVSSCNGTTTIMLCPHFPNAFSATINPLVLTQITCRLPLSSCKPQQWRHLDGLELADPNFHKPASIDILLGADVFWGLLKDGKKNGPDGTPTALNSKLGWLVAGTVQSFPSNEIVVHYADCDLEESIQKLWQLDQVSSTQPQSIEEMKCEEHFAATHRRTSDGRIEVELPLKEPPSSLGNSKASALRRFHSLERRLIAQPEMKKEYVKFMRDYLSLGHMELLTDDEEQNPTSDVYYIPHHWVLKEDSTTTKFRVVFDASATTTSGKSLNDILMVGPTLQDGVVEIVTRFRRHAVAFTADIAKMYRQILVKKEQCDLQRIYWRESPSDPLKSYRLLTVTYGTASAPFLATRSLQQLAKVHALEFPEAVSIVLEDFFVDDCLSGHSSLSKTLVIQQQLLQLLQKGCLELRKWSSNHKEVLSNLPESLRESSPDLSIGLDPSVKTLGLKWNTKSDCFFFKVTVSPADPGKLTKRIILSHVAKLFDPLGWLAPVIICGKILIQSLWKLNIGWDESPPETIITQFVEFEDSLPHLETISIPRWTCRFEAYFSLVGFSDASEKAYAAVVYLVSSGTNNQHQVSLISSKTRVAPAKQVSLPRLELCSAHLLSILMNHVSTSIKLPIKSITAYSDSTIALAWIAASPTRWKTFVANRVADIQRNLPTATWLHVRSEENPADCASRGIPVAELVRHPLWWTGPSWMTSTSQQAQQQNHIDNNEDITKEERTTQVCLFGKHAVPAPLQLLIDKISSWHKLRRVAAWCLRYIHNTRKSTPRHKGPVLTGALSTEELQQAEIELIKVVQLNHFREEIATLKLSSSDISKSKLLPLSPFLDNSGVLRVGGRLKHSRISFNRKHPVLLPRESNLTTSLIQSCHADNSHAGPQLIQSILSQRYWIVRCRDAVRLQLKKCITCHRLRSQLQQQMMADLPAVRVNPGRAFLRCGVDYAGPCSIRPATRSKTITKSYICVIVCLTTRAIHLELVGSLTTDGFLACLRRFTSRRGRPNEMWSDCGTNFVGADKELGRLLTQSNHDNNTADALSREGINWRFNPPGAPHFGGIWEAGVKSIKYHLKRTLTTTPLTYEEFSTVLCQVESCLNSRPLTPLSVDPDDFQVLTPGHFLIGEPLISVADPDLSGIHINRLSRWQLLQRLRQEFWKRWSLEYLTRLQQRPKWMKSRTNLKLNDMVIIKDECLPPQQWKLGRIIAVHPGTDGLVRVVTLRTSSGELKRPIAKVSLLPIDTSNDPSSPLVDTSVSRGPECSV